jgi:hypothetical protein
MFHRSLLHLLVTANVVPSSLIPSTVMMEAIDSFETSVLTRGTRRHIPEDGIPLEINCLITMKIFVEKTFKDEPVTFVDIRSSKGWLYCSVQIYFCPSLM